MRWLFNFIIYFKSDVSYDMSLFHMSFSIRRAVVAKPFSRPAPPRGVAPVPLIRDFRQHCCGWQMINASASVEIRRGPAREGGGFSLYVQWQHTTTTGYYALTGGAMHAGLSSKLNAIRGRVADGGCRETAGGREEWSIRIVWCTITRRTGSDDENGYANRSKQRKANVALTVL